MADILVLPTGVHGIPITEYAAALRDRLPEHQIVTAETPAESQKYISDVTVATGRTLDEDLLEEASDKLSMFVCSYAGTGHLPMEAINEREITVINASGVHGPNIAEYVIGGILAATHRFNRGRRQQSRREWRHYPVGELQGDTVTVVGLGAIGQAVVARLQGFNVNTIGVRYTPDKGGPTDEVIGLTDQEAFEDALARTNHLVLATPLTELTEGLIGHEEFEILPSSATITNIARGPVIDTEALVTALRRGWIGHAILDVTDPEPLPEDHPLWTFDNVRITPHNSGYTPQYYDRLADIVATNLRRYENNDSLVNTVNNC
ncbi:D-2-hydroxyacid dehydrogenase [Salinarchaeum sp. IM2453]|uniref:D-2-hydroxyacid dehydrogenase n=1 Tax=Salinarchaeum sp. IM2453 TaxID=2862870 RepID=UPI001C82D7CF|nr:D-2-hydroxyacid dehydrogenase [Salinarchaeum sp. IM2453]QZA87925.1 D-2-hydroxyacid dehydrogenase [Salinarchaeum sp. IM2453]